MGTSPIPSVSECLFAAIALLAWYVAIGWIAIGLTLAVIALWWLRGIADNLRRDLIQEMLHPERRSRVGFLRGVVWLLAAGLSACLFFVRR